MVRIIAATTESAYTRSAIHWCRATRNGFSIFSSPWFMLRTPRAAKITQVFSRACNAAQAPSQNGRKRVSRHAGSAPAATSKHAKTKPRHRKPAPATRCLRHSRAPIFPVSVARALMCEPAGPRGVSAAFLASNLYQISVFQPVEIVRGHQRTAANGATGDLHPVVLGHARLDA